MNESPGAGRLEPGTEYLWSRNFSPGGQRG
jgi:hypothetical protein